MTGENSCVKATRYCLGLSILVLTMLSVRFSISQYRKYVQEMHFAHVETQTALLYNLEISLSLTKWTQFKFCNSYALTRLFRQRKTQAKCSS